MSVSVVDESGRLVYYARSDGTGFFTFDTSRAKAMEITDNKDANPLLWYSLPNPRRFTYKKRRACDWRKWHWWRQSAGRS